MNNAEKFKEVFGLDLAQPQETPCIFHSKYCINGWSCDGCPLQNFWTKKYNPELREYGKGQAEKAETKQRDKYHTCGSCKHEQLPEDVYPCDRCMYGPDDRYDFWEAKDDE